jgi:hypothetical protein
MLWGALVLVLGGCSGDDESNGGSGGTATGGSGGSTTGGTGGSSTGGNGGTAGQNVGGSAGSTTGGSGGAAGSGGARASTGTMVPLYTYPSDSSWTAIVAAKEAHPTVPVIAVFNPNSGPGASVDATYVTATNDLKNAGIVVLGYVPTGYAARDANEVKAEIDDYVAWYPATTGIFFDEQSNEPGFESYYSDLDTYVKSKSLTFTVGNPGTDTAESYVGALDMMLIYETDGLPSVSSLGGWHDAHDKHNFGIIPYKVPSLDASFVAQAKDHVGYIYLTDDDLPNPWDSLPPYFDALLGELEK